MIDKLIESQRRKGDILENASVTLPPQVVNNDLQYESKEHLNLRGMNTLVLGAPKDHHLHVFRRRSNESTAEPRPNSNGEWAFEEEMLVRLRANITKNTGVRNLKHPRQ